MAVQFSHTCHRVKLEDGELSVGGVERDPPGDSFPQAAALGSGIQFYR